MNIPFQSSVHTGGSGHPGAHLHVLPATSYQMGKLFGLFDIEFSNETETACVECRTTPRLLLNKGLAITAQRGQSVRTQL